MLLGKVETYVGAFILAALLILLYMGFKIGAFRLDKYKYSSYKVYFKDVSGVTRKSEVRIAGVKVGWVEDLALVRDGKMQAKIDIAVLKSFVLYSNAYAIVRQDGLLGTKFIEVVPGDPLLRSLKSGQSLSEPSVSPVNVDEILQQVKDIATNVEDVTKSFKQAVGGVKGEVQIKSIFDNLQEASRRFASFSDLIDKSLSKNEENIDAILKIGENVRNLTDKLDQKVLPAFQDSIEKISDVFDRDFDRVANKVGETADALSDASLQARDSLRHLGSVAEKIDEGQGVLGKLINEDETYRDIKVAAEGIKNYFARIDRLQIIFDSHFESMYRPAENYRYEDSKGYFNIRIHPNDYYFYLIQLASSQKGFYSRKDTYREYEDQCGNWVDPCKLDLTDKDRLRFIFTKKKEKIRRNTFKIGFQFGKIFGPLAFRFGLFEGSAGLAVDFDIPLKSEKFRWVTTLEGFDFTGWNRRYDRRPHLKWLNKVFLFRNIYMSFGADDFISKHNANAFGGIGIRFGDDDIKYFASTIGGSGRIASIS